MQTGRNILDRGEGDARRYLGHLFDWKATGDTTGRNFALVEIEGWKGGEPPMHYHTREDEFFYLLEGEATFMIGDELGRIGRGGFVWAPRNTPHGFVFETERVRMLIGFLPAGQEAAFHAFSTPDPHRRPASPLGPADTTDFGAIQALDETLGVIYVGPPLAEILAARQT